MTELEEQIAHLQRMVDDLSEVVARQDQDIVRLTRRVSQLMERERAREAEGSVTIGDKPPPHY